MPLDLLRRVRPDADRDGSFTDGYVLVTTVVFALWLALAASPPPFRFLTNCLWRWAAVAFLIWWALGFTVFLLSWIVIDAERPANVRRAVLLFLFNLIQLRFVLCLIAALVGGMSPDLRWQYFAGLKDTNDLHWAIVLPYQLLTWLVVGLAIGAAAGLLRTSDGSAT
ncbi:MAG: hypothetical protein WBC97_01965 [Gemmatimonadales bacterium]